jgi:hypothetical protein
VRALSRAFRHNYLRGLQHLWSNGQLLLPGRLAPLAAAPAFAQFLGPLADKDWVVYAQPPFAGPATVLDYLSRYTHRIALSNHRLRRRDGDQVTFDYRDRRDGNRLKQRTLPAHEFSRRFLQHVLPPGCCRIRHFGFLGNRVKDQRLQRCRLLLGAAPRQDPALPTDAVRLLLCLTGIDVTRCPRCAARSLRVVQRLAPLPAAAAAGPQPRPPAADSS